MTPTDLIAAISTMSPEDKEALASLLLGDDHTNRSRNRTSTTTRKGRSNTMANAKLSAKQRIAARKAGTKTSAAKPAQTKTTGKTTASKGSTKSAEVTQGKRDASQAQMQKLIPQAVKLAKAGKTRAEIAAELNVTPGKAAFLLMLNAVAQGDVPRIEARTEQALVNAIANARAKADEYSSWGWLAARADKPESWIKVNLEAAGKYTPRAENIATVRSGSASNGGGKKSTTTKTTAKATGKKPVASKTAAAKAKAAARKSKANPSK